MMHLTSFSTSSIGRFLIWFQLNRKVFYILRKSPLDKVKKDLKNRLDELQFRPGNCKWTAILWYFTSLINCSRCLRLLPHSLILTHNHTALFLQNHQWYVGGNLDFGILSKGTSAFRLKEPRIEPTTFPTSSAFFSHLCLIMFNFSYFLYNSYIHWILSPVND